MAGPVEEPDLSLDIDEQGDVHPGSKAVVRRLAAAAGRWRLVPSVRDLLVMQRAGDALADERGGVLLCGVIDAPGALANLLNFIHFSSIDGALGVYAGMTRKTLYFARGQVLAATSNLPEDRLGALLVRFGLLTEDRLVSAIREITPNRRLGNVLVDKGFMTQHDLYEGVRRQVEEIFFSTLLFRRGAFYLSRLADDTVLPARLHLDTQALLLEGMRRIDEMSYFRAKVPSPDVVLARRSPAPPGEPEGPALAVYRLVDDARPLRDIARQSRLGEFAATKATFELLQTGFIEVVQVSELRRVKPVPVRNLPENAAGTIMLAYNGALARLYAAMSAKGKASSLRDGVAAFLAGSARYASLFRGVELGADGSLDVGRLVLNLEATEEAARLEHLQRGLNELLFFVLFVAGDAIERHEEQELHERVAQALSALPKAREATAP